MVDETWAAVANGEHVKVTVKLLAETWKGLHKLLHDSEDVLEKMVQQAKAEGIQPDPDRAGIRLIVGELEQIDTMLGGLLIMFGALPQCYRSPNGAQYWSDSDGNPPWDVVEYNYRQLGYRFRDWNKLDGERWQLFMYSTRDESEWPEWLKKELVRCD